MTSVNVALFPAIYAVSYTSLSCFKLSHYSSWAMQQLHSIVCPIASAISLVQINDTDPIDYIAHKNMLLTRVCFWEVGYYAFDLMLCIQHCIHTKRYSVTDLGCILYAPRRAPGGSHELFCVARDASDGNH